MMYNQGLTIGRIDLSNVADDPPADQNASEKPGMHQLHPPPYQEYPSYPHARYLPSRSHPAPYGHPGQQYGAPGANQGSYSQEQYPGWSVNPQGQQPGQPGTTIQPNAFTIPMPAPYGYTGQQYGAQGANQGSYSQEQYPGWSVNPQGQQPGQLGTTIQPTAFTTPMPPAIPMPDYLCYSIFTLLCCCFPLGIVAVVFSVATQDANRSGHGEVAERSSRKTLILNNIALIFGITTYIVLITVIVLIVI